MAARISIAVSRLFCWGYKMRYWRDWMFPAGIVVFFFTLWIVLHVMNNNDENSKKKSCVENNGRVVEVHGGCRSQWFCQLPEPK